MATYAQEKRVRQNLLRQVKQAHRILDTNNERLRRLLESKRRARTILDADDCADLNRYTQTLVTSLQNYQVKLGGLFSYIGST